MNNVAAKKQIQQRKRQQKLISKQTKNATSKQKSKQTNKWDKKHKMQQTKTHVGVCPCPFSHAIAGFQ